MADQTLLHQMDSLECFSDRAEVYAQYRPDYPVQVIDTILEGLNMGAGLVAADVGAGTGISSRLLGDRGLQVYAIEPNLAMRQAATSHPQVTFQAGNAENTGLPDTSVDLVTCFQAFHWFDPTRCLPEFHRILKPSGRLAVVWNIRDRTDKFTNGYSEIVRQLSNQHPAEERMASEQPLRTSPQFGNLRQQTFKHLQKMNLAGLIGRAQSTSYLPKDKQTQQHLIQELQTLYNRWADEAGWVFMVYQTQVFLAEPKHP